VRKFAIGAMALAVLAGTPFLVSAQQTDEAAAPCFASNQFKLRPLLYGESEGETLK
jgi:hypothetical protein